MPKQPENEAVVWDSIDWPEIEAEEKQSRSDDEARARLEAEKRKIVTIEPTAAEVERGKLEAEHRALETERQAIEAERKRMADAEAARKAEDSRRAESERIERERREQEARTQRESEERSRHEEELRLKQEREEQARRAEDERLCKIQEEKALAAELEVQKRTHEQRVIEAKRTTPPPSPDATSTKPWGGAENTPATEPVKPKPSCGALSPLFQTALNQLTPPVAPALTSNDVQPEEEQALAPSAPNPPQKRNLLGSAFAPRPPENPPKD